MPDGQQGRVFIVKRGAAIFLTSKDALDGKLANAVLIDWICAKIDRVVRSSFEAEINSAQMTLDQAAYGEAMWYLIQYGMTLKEYQAWKERPQSALAGDNKGLYTAIYNANPITTKGEKRLTIDKMIMRDHLDQNNVRYYWVNANHQIADAFTKLSTAGGRSDLLMECLNETKIRLTYSEVSGKKETKQQSQRNAAYLRTQFFNIAEQEEDGDDGANQKDIHQPNDVDEWFQRP